MKWMGLAALVGIVALIAFHFMAAHGDNTAMQSSSTPYAGMEQRSVKGLSDLQIADLKAGRGMGLALPAELNGYPGPAHVLELADTLQLSDEQRVKTKALFDAMKAETIPIGAQIIADETTLDRMFADKGITRASLGAITARIGEEQGKLQAAHLSYHLAIMEVLSPPQVARYAELRGYAAGSQHDHVMH
jgi:hypothetical protein